MIRFDCALSASSSYSCCFETRRWSMTVYGEGLADYVKRRHKQSISRRRSTSSTTTTAQKRLNEDEGEWKRQLIFPVAERLENRSRVTAAGQLVKVKKKDQNTKKLRRRRRNEAVHAMCAIRCCGRERRGEKITLARSAGGRDCSSAAAAVKRCALNSNKLPLVCLPACLQTTTGFDFACIIIVVDCWSRWSRRRKTSIYNSEGRRVIKSNVKEEEEERTDENSGHQCVACVASINANEWSDESKAILSLSTAVAAAAVVVASYWANATSVPVSPLLLPINSCLMTARNKRQPNTNPTQIKAAKATAAAAATLRAKKKKRTTHGAEDSFIAAAATN